MLTTAAVAMVLVGLLVLVTGEELEDACVRRGRGGERRGQQSARIMAFPVVVPLPPPGLGVGGVEHGRRRGRGSGGGGTRDIGIDIVAVRVDQDHPRYPVQDRGLQLCYRLDGQGRTLNWYRHRHLNWYLNRRWL